MAARYTPERRQDMFAALYRLGYYAAADKCLTDPSWEDWYSDFLGSMYGSLTVEEQRAIYPWNFDPEG